ncbi:MAG: MBL fold metallo-hydrolase [Theionarchaea archaeon]|nr:MBL fold metallo-hydrolase [Theionarchaea archaeon]
MDGKSCINPYKVCFLFVILIPLCSCYSGNRAPLEKLSRDAVQLSQDTPGEEIEITFISNAGFLIASGEKKILVDGLWNSTMGEKVPWGVRELMEKAQPPFDDVNLALTTHIHADHFDASVAGAHLENNPNSIFVSTKEVIESLESLPGFSSIQDRVRAVQPKRGERILLTLNGIDTEVLNLHHGIGVFERNNAYIFTIGGLKLFHTGDIGVTFEEIQVYELFNDEIDIAFVPYSYMTHKGEEERILMEGIKAKRIIPIHIQPSYGRDTLERIDEEYPEAIVFYEKMQTIIVSSPLEEIEKQIEEEEELEEEVPEEEEEEEEVPEEEEEPEEVPEEEEEPEEVPADEGICLGTILLLSLLVTGISLKKSLNKKKRFLTDQK